jgi:hypothetical protein
MSGAIRVRGAVESGLDNRPSRITIYPFGQGTVSAAIAEVQPADKLQIGSELNLKALPRSAVVM